MSSIIVLYVLVCILGIGMILSGLMHGKAFKNFDMFADAMGALDKDIARVKAILEFLQDQRQRENNDIIQDMYPMLPVMNIDRRQEIIRKIVATFEKLTTAKRKTTTVSVDVLDGNDKFMTYLITITLNQAENEGDVNTYDVKARKSGKSTEEILQFNSVCTLDEVGSIADAIIYEAIGNDDLANSYVRLRDRIVDFATEIKDANVYDEYMLIDVPNMDLVLKLKKIRPQYDIVYSCILDVVRVRYRNINGTYQRGELEQYKNLEGVSMFTASIYKDKAKFLNKEKGKYTPDGAECSNFMVIEKIYDILNRTCDVVIHSTTPEEIIVAEVPDEEVTKETVEAEVAETEAEETKEE